ncbi:MAG TPA: CAP domain-containing protein [bacterium]|nr:CAP domain-containing protein [bacterium]
MLKIIIQKIHLFFIPHQKNGYKPHALRHQTLWLYSFLLLAAKAGVLLVMFFVYPSPAEFSTITANRIVELTNKARVEYNLPVLKMSDVLNQAAQKKAQDMILNDYFAHNSPQGINPWHWFKEVGYNYTYAGENLAMNFVDAENALQAWLDSPSHRENLLGKNYEDIGVAVVLGKINGQETTLVVQLFGTSFARVAGLETFGPSAKIIETPTTADKLTDARESVVISDEAGVKVVTLSINEKTGWFYKLVSYSSKLFYALLIFVFINLLLTIFIRIEIQHKPIIIHSLCVIVLALAMILLHTHFMEGLGKILVV